MFRNFFSPRLGSLHGTPSLRRLKTYSAQTGYVYQYAYEGYRECRGRGGEGTEFVFRVSSDTKNWGLAHVVLGNTVARAWEEAHAQTLSETERYAIAKMALFQAFDERLTPSLMKQPVRVRPADLDAILETLGIDSDE